MAIKGLNPTGKVMKPPKKKKAEVESAEGTVEITKGGLTEEKKEVVLPPSIFLEEAANVGVTLSYTKNLGNYESMKIQISLHMPCYPKEIDQVAGFVGAWVDEKLQEEIANINKIVGG